MPQALSSSLRFSPMSVIQPSGSPIIHSVNLDESLWFPSLPSGLVGSGAGLPIIASHRLMAELNLPQLVSVTSPLLNTALATVSVCTLPSLSCGCEPSL